MGGTIDGLLGGGGRVNSGHETLNDTELVVDDLSEGSKAVGCARGIGDLDLESVVIRDPMTYGGCERVHTTVSVVLYLSRLTPTTYMGASADGAEIMTFLAPPFK